MMMPSTDMVLCPRRRGGQHHHGAAWQLVGMLSATAWWGLESVSVGISAAGLNPPRTWHFHVNSLNDTENTSVFTCSHSLAEIVTKIVLPRSHVYKLLSIPLLMNVGFLSRIIHNQLSSSVPKQSVILFLTYLRWKITVFSLTDWTWRSLVFYSASLPAMGRQWVWGFG